MGSGAAAAFFLTFLFLPALALFGFGGVDRLLGFAAGRFGSAACRVVVSLVQGLAGLLQLVVAGNSGDADTQRSGPAPGAADEVGSALQRGHTGGGAVQFALEPGLPSRGVGGDLVSGAVQGIPVAMGLCQGTGDGGEVLFELPEGGPGL